MDLSGKSVCGSCDLETSEIDSTVFLLYVALAVVVAAVCIILVITVLSKVGDSKKSPSSKGFLVTDDLLLLEEQANEGDSLGK